MVNSEFYSAALREADSAECNNALVMESLSKAEQEGDLRATYALSQCYRYGSFGTVIDLERAHKLTKQLENSNIAEAVFNLALDYDKGNFVRTNLKKAFSLYVVAGLLGDKESCEQVACFYRVGEVVPRNKVLEKAWRARARCDETLMSPPYRCWLR
jgi:uncharacterized protein